MSHRKNLIPYLIIICGTIVVDWILGVLCASGIIPLWTFLIANFPFGGLYVWMESSWVGTHYEMHGRFINISDEASFVIFGISALAQASLYYFLWYWFKIRKINRLALSN
jgi:hypothetical protein